MITDIDMKHLERTVELAREAVGKGHRPFGSVLVSKDGTVLYEDHNQIGTGDNTQHPEFNLARWAGQNMTEAERLETTAYTSGEHCPMCAAAHGLAGLGRIVYASSSKQLAGWLEEMGITDTSRLRRLPIQDIITDVEVDGPVKSLASEIKQLHRKYYENINPTVQQ